MELTLNPLVCITFTQTSFSIVLYLSNVTKSNNVFIFFFLQFFYLTWSEISICTRRAKRLRLMHYFNSWLLILFKAALSFFILSIIGILYWITTATGFWPSFFLHCHSEVATKCKFIVKRWTFLLKIDFPKLGKFMVFNLVFFLQNRIFCRN